MLSQLQQPVDHLLDRRLMPERVVAPLTTFRERRAYQIGQRNREYSESGGAGAYRRLVTEPSLSST